MKKGGQMKPKHKEKLPSPHTINFTILSNSTPEGRLTRKRKKQMSPKAPTIIPPYAPYRPLTLSILIAPKDTSRVNLLASHVNVKITRRYN